MSAARDSSIHPLLRTHSSHLDALALATPLRLPARSRILARAGDVFFESAVSTAFAAGLVNALPVWRKRRSPRALQGAKSFWKHRAGSSCSPKVRGHAMATTSLQGGHRHVGCGYASPGYPLPPDWYHSRRFVGPPRSSAAKITIRIGLADTLRGRAE